jgi:selenocysteine lyase/cysteine desulfurase
MAPTHMVTDEWLARVQADFPYQKGQVYLQSAGAGLAFPGAAAAAGQYYVDVAALGCDAQPLWHRPVDSAKERVARLLDVPIEDVGFFRNTSEIINLVANSVQWRRGDEVIFLSDEYPCNVLPWGGRRRPAPRSFRWIRATRTSASGACSTRCPRGRE